jgi:2-phospho-L-lactate guanylyltransferase
MTKHGEKTWALVPVKAFDSAKSRLTPCLAPPSRAQLARSMFEHVLEMLKSAARINGVLVVTDSAETARIAASLGAAVLRDRATGPLDVHVDDGLSDLARRGVTRALVIMSDLPNLTCDDVEALLSALDEADVVIAPDSSGHHTNALGVYLPHRLTMSFGRDDSFHLHLQFARAAGLSLARVDTPTLAFDVDTPDDYAKIAGRRGVAAKRAGAV